MIFNALLLISLMGACAKDDSPTAASDDLNARIDSLAAIVDSLNPQPVTELTIEDIRSFHYDGDPDSISIVSHGDVVFGRAYKDTFAQRLQYHTWHLEVSDSRKVTFEVQIDTVGNFTEDFNIIFIGDEALLTGGNGTSIGSGSMSVAYSPLIDPGNYRVVFYAANKTLRDFGVDRRGNTFTLEEGYQPFPIAFTLKITTEE